MADQPESIDRLLGAKILSLREHQGLSRSALAVQIGVNAKTIEDYEMGRVRMSASVLKLIVQALDASVADIFSALSPSPEGR